jgi:hypothetical protein
LGGTLPTTSCGARRVPWSMRRMRASVGGTPGRRLPSFGAHQRARWSEKCLPFGMWAHRWCHNPHQNEQSTSSGACRALSRVFTHTQASKKIDKVI